MPTPHDGLVRRLAEACRHGDLDAVRATLHDGAVAISDGAGLSPASGADDVALFVTALLGGRPVTTVSVNGQAGLALRHAGRAVAVVAVTSAGTAITALWVVLDPAKLTAWHQI